MVHVRFFLVHVVIVRFCVFLFFCSRLCGFDGAHLSSKAICAALKARESLESGPISSQQRAIIDLEGILREPSFRRLDIQEQVHILFILSRGYEQVGNYEQQEKLLSAYANRREFYRFYLPLRVALVRSFVKQERIQDADLLVKKMIKSSCAQLSVEEKGVLADIVEYKDKALYSIVQRSDQQALLGQLERALNGYQKVLESVQRDQFPYQASPVARKKLAQFLTLRIAEVVFSQGDFSSAVSFVQEWDEQLCQDSGLRKRRFFLLAESYQKMGDKEKSEEFFSLCRGLLKPTLSKSYTLFKAQKAIKNRSSEQLKAVIEELDDAEIRSILTGFMYAFDDKLSLAVDTLMEGISKTHCVDSPWVHAACDLLLEAGWQRVVLLLFSHQIVQAEQLVAKIIDISSFYDSPRKDWFFLFLQKRTQNYEKALDKNKLHPFVSLVLEARPEDAFSWIVQNGTLSDKLFYSWLFPEMNPTYVYGTTFASEKKDNSPVSYYLRAVLAYQQAMCDEIDQKRVTPLLYELLGMEGIQDVYPQILNCLVELALRRGDVREAFELLVELFDEYPEYSRLPQLALSCMVMFASDDERQFECERVTEYFLKRPIDAHTIAFLALLKKPLVGQCDEGLRWIERAFFLKGKAIEYTEKLSVSHESGVIKDMLLLSKHEMDDAQLYLHKALLNIDDRGAHASIWGAIISAHQTLLDTMCQTLIEGDAFNELPVYIEQARFALQEDIDLLQNRFSEWKTYFEQGIIEKTFESISSARLCVAIFQGSRVEVLDTIKNLLLSQKYTSRTVRIALFLAKKLREDGRLQEGHELLSLLYEKNLKHIDIELALEIAIEKSLCFRERKETDKAMSMLAWIINGPYSSSLRVKAMILRAELYLLIHRKDLAVRQLESVVSKGGEWAVVAEGKLRELYGIN